MYLRINESSFIISKYSDYKVDYNIKSNNDTLLVNSHVVLFDDEWNIIDDVFNFLQNRQNLKRQAFNTIVIKGQDLKLYYSFLKQYKLNPHKIDNKKINDFIAWLMLPDTSNKQIYLHVKTNRTAKTINRIVSSIRDFYKYLEAFKDIENPFKHEYKTIKRPTFKNKSFLSHTQDGVVQKSIFKVKEFKKGVRVLSREQCEAILTSDVALPRDKLLFELLLLTGMRIGEALNLNINAVGISQIGEPVQEIKMSKASDNQVGLRQRQLKTGNRDIFIPTKLAKKLEQYYEDTWLKYCEEKQIAHEYLFISESKRSKGEPLSYQSVWERCRVVGNSLGFSFTPHDFRHTFATNLARSNIGIEKLRRLLGHRDMSSTDIYIQIANKESIATDLIPFFESYGISDVE